jgi:hypothetical protein
MNTLICGSSYTSGDGLKDRSLAWPSIFQNLSGQTVINTAVDGGSVDYVFYSVIKEVSTHGYKNVIVTWPPLGRKLMVRRENNFLINGTPTFTNALYGNNKEFRNYLKLLYKYWSNELYDLKFTLQKILLLQNFLKNKKCEYLFVNTTSYYLNAWMDLSILPAATKNVLLSAFDLMNDSQILEEECEINSYVDQLDFTCYHDPIGYNLAEDCTHKGLIDLTTQHPSIEGHQYIANLIWKLWNG